MRTLFTIMFLLMGLSTTFAQIEATAFQGNPNNWSDKSDLASIGQSAGFNIKSSESKASSAKPNGFFWRFKLSANGFVEFPELKNLGNITLHIAGGAPNDVQVYGVDYDYKSINIDKMNVQGDWETFETVGNAMPKAEMCKTYTVNCNVQEAVKIRVFNASGYSIWVYAMEVTPFGSVATDRLPYAFNANDMPPSNSGAVPYPTAGTPWNSKLLDMDANGKLTYNKDNNGFILPDFSHAGYQNGNQPIPDVPVVKTISPIEGDNTEHIQQAINEVGALPLNNNGIRGALLLTKGLYEVKGPIYLNFDGVVLRGEGNQADPATNTVIYDSYRDPDAKAAWRTVLLVGNKTADNWNASKTDEEPILDNVVPVGSKVVRIAKNSNYQVGDLVCIYHPCTDAWLAAINYGEVGNNPDVYKDWTAGTAPIYYHRTVTKVTHQANETLVEFNAPVFYTLQKALSQSVIYRFTRVSLQNIGIENLRVDCAAKTIPDENHSWNCIGFKNADNCWARDVVTTHFGQAGFFTERATGITFERCMALDPVGEVTGERMYNFNQASRSQLILYKECYARGGRHNFVSNGTSTVSGCVVYKCKSEGSRTSSEGHRIWTQGMLFDSYEDFNPISNSTSLVTLGFYNRWNMGSGHGWAMVHGVMWNCNMVTDHTTAEAKANSANNTRTGIYCEKPPTAQNYAIGCRVENSSDVKTYKKSIGYVEGTNQSDLQPASLFEAQLFDRQNNLSALRPLYQKQACITFDSKQQLLHIENDESVSMVSVFNIQGELIFTSAPNTENVSLSTQHWHSGLTIISVTSRHGTQTQKVCIQ